MSDIRDRIIEAPGGQEANAAVVLRSVERQLASALDLVRLLIGSPAPPAAPGAPETIETLGGGEGTVEA